MLEEVLFVLTSWKRLVLTRIGKSCICCSTEHGLDTYLCGVILHFMRLSFAKFYVPVSDIRYKKEQGVIYKSRFDNVTRVCE